MTKSVSSEKLLIFECNGATFCTVYAGGRVNSGMMGRAERSANGPAQSGCNGELLVSFKSVHQVSHTGHEHTLRSMQI